jgi:two-component system sensor histidine kinase YesM
MNPMTKMKIKQQLFLLFVLLVTPVFLMNGYANRQVEETIKVQVTDAYSELIKQSHSLIGRDIDTVNKITTTIIQNPITQRLEPNSTELRPVIDHVKSYVELDALLESYSLAVNGGQSISYWL